MSELEKLGPKYKIALQIARDERWERESCVVFYASHTDFVQVYSVITRVCLSLMLRDCLEY